MAFSFGFSGDDIEEDPNDASNAQQDTPMVEDGGNGPPPIKAQTHDLDEMVCKTSFRYLLHLFISYCKLPVTVFSSKSIPTSIQPKPNLQQITHHLTKPSYTPSPQNYPTTYSL
jgi:hypothetical protein